MPAGFTSVYYDEAGKEMIMPFEVSISEYNVLCLSECLGLHTLTIQKTENCYYQGNVEGHPQWIASMSTCQGLE